jgi:DNA-binding PadR family transcriptional regulator
MGEIYSLFHYEKVKPYLEGIRKPMNCYYLLLHLTPKWQTTRQLLNRIEGRSRRFSFTPTQISGMLKILNRKGLVETKPGKPDKRTRLYRLTPEAMRLIHDST